MVDLFTNFAGARLQFPTVVAPGPLTKDGIAVRKAALQDGVGAVVVKTVYKNAEDTPRPSMAAMKGSMINHDWSAISAEQFTRELKIAREGKKPVIVSILGSIADTVEMAKMLEKAGADMLELPIGVPPIEELTDNIKRIKEAVEIPLGVKIGPDVDIPKYAKAIEGAGADYISGINTLGPALAVDVSTGKPLLGAKMGYGYLSGPAIKPIALRCVAEMARNVKIPVMGGGGISDGKDAMEFFMVGATCVHLHTVAILRGLGAFAKIVKEIEEFLKNHGYDSVEDVRGKSLKYLNEDATYAVCMPVVNSELCTACGACERACVYGAMKVKEVAQASREKCFGCGLCSTVCPTRAIELEKGG